MHNTTRKGPRWAFYDLAISVLKPFEILHLGQKKSCSRNSGVSAKSGTKRREETGTVSKRWEGGRGCERGEKNGGGCQGVSVRRQLSQQWFCSEPLARLTKEWTAVNIPMAPSFLLLINLFILTSNPPLVPGSSSIKGKISLPIYYLQARLVKQHIACHTWWGTCR